jgi:hypothetical protein
LLDDFFEVFTLSSPVEEFGLEMHAFFVGLVEDVSVLLKL